MITSLSFLTLIPSESLLFQRKPPQIEIQDLRRFDVQIKKICHMIINCQVEVMLTQLSKLLFVLLFICTESSIKPEDSHEFCWKDSYGRGVGTIPNQCGKLVKIGALCYDQCPDGYKRFGFDCHQECPSNFRDDGLFCRLAEYGRGAGYAIWSQGKCKKDNPTLGCQKYGLMWYPKCKPGYHNVLCCICRPDTPNCAALGMNNGIDLSCGKKIIIGNPRPMSCSDELEYSAGLCYKSCKSGFSGVGPVCWADPPSGWVGCGMGAAKDKKVCADTTIGQITAVGEMALSITQMVLTYGGSTAASGATKAAANAGKIAQLKDKMMKIKKAIEESKKFKELVDKAKKIKQKAEEAKEIVDQATGILDTVKTLAEEDYSNYTEADYVRLAASVAALADPTGIAGTIEKFSHPKCSQIFKN